MSDLDIHRHYHGLVDMGSNGIRFSITNLSPPTTRSLPTLYQSRSGISLYDAQYTTTDGSRGPIPSDVISDVISVLLRFKITCKDFGVPDENITVLATEATRTAVNSVEFLDVIKEKTGWDVKLLAKEEEGRIGAMGIASSFEEVKGLVMDLGGGSTQITWMIASNGNVQTSPSGSTSFPYGAAAMVRRLLEAEKSQNPTASRSALAEEMKSNFSSAFSDLQIPTHLSQSAESEGGFSLYLSGGGFRGWGYLLMSQHTISGTSSPYPIPIINGYKVPVSSFKDTMTIQSLASGPSKIFRVSRRRASQVPAVAFLVNALIDALPNIKNIQFCQGGVREGFLFDALSESIRSQPPLPAATSVHASPSSSRIADLLLSALPQPSNGPVTLTPSLLLSLSQTLYLHSPNPKETAPLSALYSTTTGPLSSAHGILHSDRAMLALMLCERWDGELPPGHDLFRSQLDHLLSVEEAWWTRYLGRVAGLIGSVYPAGIVREGEERVLLQAAYGTLPRGKKGEVGEGIKLVVGVRSGDRDGGLDLKSIRELGEGIAKLGKKKNWVRDSEGDVGEAWGLLVEVEVVEMEG